MTRTTRHQEPPRPVAWALPALIAALLGVFLGVILALATAARVAALDGRAFFPPRGGAIGCGGDCDGDGAVAINELIAMVNAALDPGRIGDCPAGDRDGNGRVTIAELIAAVGYALAACPTPRIELAACGFELPPGQDPADVTCGDLVVLENRARPNGPTVRVPFAVFNASGANPVADPLVFTGSGGPGIKELDYVSLDVVDWFGAFHPDRDLVFYDQRGIGRARPLLDCPEQRAAFSTTRAKAQTVEEDAAEWRAALHACRDRLAAEGIDFAAYTSAASALDLHDLMTALGYESWNVYSLSYGTRLALTLMRDAPEGTRSVILDSTVPVQSNYLADVAASMQRTLNLIFTSCAADPSCAALYPDLEATFFDLVDRLNQEPVTLEGTDPISGEPITVVVTGDRLLLSVRNWLYDRTLIPLVPAVITSAARGNYQLLKSFVVHPVDDSQAMGMFFSVNCSEELPFITPEVLVAATAGVREEIKRVVLAAITQSWLDVCAFWGTPAPPAIENEAVASDIPTLVLAGEYDPITPTAYAQLAAATLSQSHVFQFRGFAHGIFSSGCADELKLAFLNAPTTAPDGSCVEALPPLRFFGTADAAAIAPIPTVTRRLPTLP